MAVIIDGSTYKGFWKLTPNDAAPTTFFKIPKGQIFYDTGTKKVCAITDPAMSNPFVTTGATTIDENENALATAADVAQYFEDNGSGEVISAPIDTDDTLAADSDSVVPSQKAVKAYVDDGLALKANVSTTKVYRALLTQSGTDAPVITELENTIGAITSGYSTDGSYTLNSSALFTIGKTHVLISLGSTIGRNVVVYDFSNTSIIDLYTFRPDGAQVDGLLLNASIQILVFP